MKTSHFVLFLFVGSLYLTFTATDPIGFWVLVIGDFLIGCTAFVCIAIEQSIKYHDKD